jgi:RHS repeat-associated protein
MGKELDAETGLYYYGTRYLDPRTSRRLSTDPVLGSASRGRNQSLPGTGGVFNLVKHTDPNEMLVHIAIDGIVNASIFAAMQYGATGERISQKLLLPLVQAGERRFSSNRCSVDRTNCKKWINKEMIKGIIRSAVPFFDE